MRFLRSGGIDRLVRHTVVPRLDRMSTTTTTTTATASSSSSSKKPLFLSQVEATVNKVLADFPDHAQLSDQKPRLVIRQRHPQQPKKKRRRTLLATDPDEEGSATTRTNNNNNDTEDTSPPSPPPPATTTTRTTTTTTTTCLLVPESMRGTVAVARSLHAKLRQLRRRNACEICWFPRPDSCLCRVAPPSSHPPPNVNRIFLLMHENEIGLAVDTAKMILAAYPAQGRLVVAGIGPDHQDSMQELQTALRDNPSRCLVLFPSPQATTVAESIPLHDVLHAKDKGDLDVVVLDGTWKQARRMYHRYLEHIPGLTHICLTPQALSHIASNESSSKQLRPHPQAWREIGTCAATRYLLQDLEHLFTATAATTAPPSGTDQLSAPTEPPPPPDYSKDHILTQYQQLVNEAVKKQKMHPSKRSDASGEPTIKEKHS